MIDIKQIVCKGRVRGRFAGFNKDKMFKMDSGTFWVQPRYRFWYRYCYQPEAIIADIMGKNIMYVEGRR